MLDYFRAIVAAIGGEQLTSLYEEFTVNKKIALVYERLQLTQAFAFMDLVGSGSAIEIICAFWAVLETGQDPDHSGDPAPAVRGHNRPPATAGSRGVVNHAEPPPTDPEQQSRLVEAIIALEAESRSIPNGWRG